MLHYLVQFLHPGKQGPGGGYWFWSGIGSGSPIFALIVGYLLRHNCHVKRCWRIGHTDPEHGHPACRRHHSKSDLIG